MRARILYVTFRLRWLYWCWRFTERAAQTRKWIASHQGAILGFPFLLLLVTWLTLRLGEALPHRWTPFSDSDWLGRLLAWELLISAIVLIPLLVLELHRSRRRIVIREFRRYCGQEETAKAAGPGIAALLGTELTRMAELYRTVDEASYSESGNIVRSSPSVLESGGVTEDLSATVGPDFAIPLGPVQIPAGFLLTVFGWLARGPRLSGSLHGDAEGIQYVLVAGLSGGGLSGSWKVDAADLSQDDLKLSGAALLRRMVEFLAYRIVTDLLDLGSPRFQAIDYYTQGLREVRKARLSGRDRTESLRRAEASFVKALDEDENFARAHFNLGLVYRDLHQPAAARLALRQALKVNPNDENACYALAESYYEVEAFDDAIWLARNCQEIRPRHPGAASLQSVAIWDKDRKASARDLLPPPRQEIVRGFETAALSAWWELCQAQRSDQGVEEARDIARICSLNLGIAYSHQGFSTGQEFLHQASKVVLSRALHLAPNDHMLRYILGKARWRARDYQEAFGSLDRVFRGSLDADEQQQLWSYLVSTHAHLEAYAKAKGDPATAEFHQQEAKYCYLLARETLALPGREEASQLYHKRLEGFRETLELLEKEACGPELPRFRLLSEVCKFLLAVEDASNGMLWKALFMGGSGATTLPNTGDHDWDFTQIVLRLADRLLTADQRARRPVPHVLTKLCELMTKAHSLKELRLRDLFELRLHQHLARARLDLARLEQTETVRNNHLAEALAQADQAARIDPENRDALLLLGEIHHEIGDEDEAEVNLEGCLRLAPGSPPAIVTLGRVLWARTQACYETELRREVLARAVARFSEILALTERDPDVEPLAHCHAHGWLGRLLCELEDDRGLHHLAIARTLGDTSPDLLVLMAERHLDRATGSAEPRRAADLAAANALLDQAQAAGIPAEEIQRLRIRFQELRLKGPVRAA